MYNTTDSAHLLTTNGELTNAQLMSEQQWETKDGYKIPFSQVTHQHWSNIYWYHRYMMEDMFLGSDNDYGVLTDFVKSKKAHVGRMIEVAKEQIEKRFKGVILDWIPVYDNEKGWYKKQSTRKVLVEKFKEV